MELHAEDGTARHLHGAGEVTECTVSAMVAALGGATKLWVK